MNGFCEGRVVVVTGAGRGLGRAYALELAWQGARLVVNDFGAGRDGTGQTSNVAETVVEEIRELGGEAVADGHDVADWDGARQTVTVAHAAFGTLDAVVNNAGIVRDRTLANMSIDDWDAVIRVHLRGTFVPTRLAAAYWRDQAKAGEHVNARIINTSSSSGLFGNTGQANYSAAKAGIASFTIVAARELARYGVTANAIYPTAMSRITEELFTGRGITPQSDTFDPYDPGNVAPIVAWLASTESADVTGRVFGVRGGRIVVAEGWVAGPTVDAGRRWDVAELGPVVRTLLTNAAPNAETTGLRS